MCITQDGINSGEYIAYALSHRVAGYSIDDFSTCLPLFNLQIHNFKGNKYLKRSCVLRMSIDHTRFPLDVLRKSLSTALNKPDPETLTAINRFATLGRMIGSLDSQNFQRVSRILTYLEQRSVFEDLIGKIT